MAQTYMTLEQGIESICSGRYTNRTDLLEDVKTEKKVSKHKS
jgi:hypothetical protein